MYDFSKESDAEKYFGIMKKKILEIIDLNKDKEITKYTSNTNSGIYMLYVDDFSDNTIIPFYIGQTTDYQKRYETHLKELLSLNRLKCEIYKAYLDYGTYDGYYKSCKIFTYLVNHNCTFENFHMISLEDVVDSQLRLKREKYYIDNLNSAFFGFNQFNTISNYNSYKYQISKKDEFDKIVSEDIDKLLLYNNFGYCDLNFYLAKNVLKENENFKKLLKIKKFAKLYKLNENSSDFDEQNIAESSELIFQRIYPKIDYGSHPLKDMYKRHTFPNENKENVCYINVEFTCLKANVNYDFYPYICKIDYKIIKNGEEKSREVFIKNPLNDFWNSEKVYYVEKKFVNYPYNTFCQPYNLFLSGKIDTHIPVTMEYRNGINEYTLKNITAEEELDVFKEIDALIDNKTKIVYTTSGYKSTIQRYSGISDTTPNGLLKRIISVSRR